MLAGHSRRVFVHSPLQRSDFSIGVTKHTLGMFVRFPIRSSLLRLMQSDVLSVWLSVARYRVFLCVCLEGKYYTCLNALYDLIFSTGVDEDIFLYICHFVVLCDSYGAIATTRHTRGLVVCGPMRYYSSSGT